MTLFLNFVLAFLFSFLGSIPPGTLNLTIVQLGLAHKLNIALRFAMAAALIEYPYVWLSIKFENLLSDAPLITRNFQLIAGIVMLVLGLFSLLSINKKGEILQRFDESGFRRGLILSILNPQALPFWIGVTAYLRSQQWITTSSVLEIQCYLFGASFGAFVLLISMAAMAGKIAAKTEINSFLKKIPGTTLVLLGLYALLHYFL